MLIDGDVKNCHLKKLLFYVECYQRIECVLSSNVIRRSNIWQIFRVDRALESLEF